VTQKKLCSVGGQVLVVILLTSPLWAGSPALAQSSEGNTTPPHHNRNRPVEGRLDGHVKVLAKALDLDETQQAAVKGILQGRHQKILRITKSTTLSGADRIASLRALDQATATQIRALLNEEQKKKYDPFGHSVERSSEPVNVEEWLKLTTPKQ
jgi:hypothetical protein